MVSSISSHTAHTAPTSVIISARAERKTRRGGGGGDGGGFSGTPCAPRVEEGVANIARRQWQRVGGEQEIVEADECEAKRTQRTIRRTEMRCGWRWEQASARAVTGKVRHEEWRGMSRRRCQSACRFLRFCGFAVESVVVFWLERLQTHFRSGITRARNLRARGEQSAYHILTYSVGWLGVPRLIYLSAISAVNSRN